MEKVTPPVSPKLIPKQSVPAIDPTQLPIPPDDASSLLSDNFHAIEAIMLQDYQDVWSADTSPVREFLEDELAISGQDPFLEQPRKTLEDFKIDVPLMVDRMPQRSEGLEPFKNFVDAEMDLDPEFKRALPHDIPDDPFDRELREKLEQSAQLVLRSIEQERLQAIDAMGRVPVPVMDFLIPEPAWKRLRGNNRSETNILKWIQAGKEQLFKPPSWPVDRAAASKMIWNPLAAGADKVNENESIPAGEPLLKRYLDLPLSHEVQTSRDYIHQKEKAIVLEDDDHDEDIEMQLGSEKAMVGLVDSVRKRFMNTNTGAARKRLRRHLTEQRSPNQTKDHVGPSLLPGDSPGASGDLLANFMEVHAPQKGALRHSKYFNSGPSDAPSLSAPVLAHTKQDHTQTHQLSKASIKAPCPTMGTPTTDMTIFISITIPRRMVRALEGLAPRLTLLEQIVPSLADDADITVSPSTGLIVTSMIRVRQKPRAGTTRSMLQIRVEKASLRYEKLIILIGGDGGKDDVLGFMSSSESYALLELQGFASGLDCNVQVHFVGGGDQTLTNWVAAFIFRYSLADPKIIAGLIEPETLWEVFLRRAGFNVFAAQVVASHFRPPSDKTNADSSFQYGLGAFMTMTRDERMRHFGQLVGAGIMERVSRNVDEVWNSG
ncbi:hypothetical protein N0V93_007483 [Gnomoniopsis smithogilvyi]|uniref:Uncharacterized protein n=1 Tax=Gnomoniopsis smithogilvyi TaxID=1191159 RepID=A0A9W8YQJ6_9PEZI|nr:hypothetical protein N0V93_007483 [Gnomoniopsis smithogilvyi]